MIRPLIHVACGVLIRPDGTVLHAQRPPGKLAAGKWEFPGGKIEPGETPYQALVRELHEELGIEVIEARPLLRFRHDYSDRSVILDTWRVSGWRGELQSREGQAFAWLPPEALSTLDVLPTVKPIVRALRLPSFYVFTPPDATLEFLLERLARLPRGALLRLRQPALDNAAYERVAGALLPVCVRAGIGLMLDRDPEFSARLGAAGWHADGNALSKHGCRPLAADFIVAASAHDPRQMASAQGLDVDCVVLGPVRATSTHPEAQGIGWPSFATLRGDAAMSVYALGGVGPSDLDQARQHGAQGIAGISAFWH